MPRHDNACWDCGQIHADIRPSPSDYHAHVQHLRMQSEVATEIRGAALSAWSNYLWANERMNEPLHPDVVHAFRELLKWVAHDYLPEFDSEVMLDREYRKALAERDKETKAE